MGDLEVRVCERGRAQGQAQVGVGPGQRPGDLESFCEVARDCDMPGFSEEEIEGNPTADYHFRVTVKDEDWAELVKVLAMGIDYPNFKDEVSKVDPERAAGYMGVWSEPRKIQGRE